MHLKDDMKSYNTICFVTSGVHGVVMYLFGGDVCVWLRVANKVSVTGVTCGVMAKQKLDHVLHS